MEEESLSNTIRMTSRLHVVQDTAANPHLIRVAVVLSLEEVVKSTS